MANNAGAAAKITKINLTILELPGCWDSQPQRILKVETKKTTDAGIIQSAGSEAGIPSIQSKYPTQKTVWLKYSPALRQTSDEKVTGLEWRRRESEEELEVITRRLQNPPRY